MKNNAEKNGYNPMPLCDSHIHIHHSDRAELSITVDDTCTFVRNLMKYFSYDRLCIQALTPYSSGAVDFSINAKSLYCKEKLNKQFAPESQVYVNANLIHVFNTGLTPEDELLKQAKEAYEAGCDGFKLLDGKPNLRKQHGYGLNDARYEKFFQYVEELQLPIVLHTGDPHEMWEEKVNSDGALLPPQYDETFVSMQQLRDELEEVLIKHPKLKLIIAHFYFWAAELDKFGAFLDRHPTVCFDIVPAGEEYFDLNKNITVAREFFIKYSDRILFGSDSNNWHWGEDLEQYKHNFSYPINLARDFLEAKASFHFVDDDREEIFPLQLEEKYLKKIYHDNFVRLYGKKPRAVVKEKVLDMLKILYPIYKDPSTIAFPDRKKLGGIEFTSLASRDVNLKNLNIMLQFFKSEI